MVTLARSAVSGIGTMILTFFFWVSKQVNSATKKTALPYYQYYRPAGVRVVEIDPSRKMEDYFRLINAGVILLLPRSKLSDRGYRARCILGACLLTICLVVGGFPEISHLKNSIHANTQAIQSLQARQLKLQKKKADASGKSRAGLTRTLHGIKADAQHLKYKGERYHLLLVLITAAVIVAVALGVVLLSLGTFIRRWKFETIWARRAKGTPADYVSSVHFFSLNWWGKQIGLSDLDKIQPDRNHYWSNRSTRYCEIVGLIRGEQKHQDVEVWRWEYVPTEAREYVFDFLVSLQSHIRWHIFQRQKEGEQYAGMVQGESISLDDPRLQS